MISEQAKTGFEHLFLMALKSRLPLSEVDSCEITPISELDSIAKYEAPLFILTISSIRFRLLFILQVADDEGIRFYYASHGAKMALDETFLELANLCCGLLSQGLQAHFPDLGMSTPYILNGPCLAYLEGLNPGYLARYSVLINSSAQVLATVCVCEYDDIDFSPNLTAFEECNGELEMF